MKLSSLRVQNFRSIKDTGSIRIMPLFALIGENNCGKSNLLYGVDLLLSAGTAELTKDDFNEPGSPIVITGEFESLTDSEVRRWRSYLVNNRLILEKRFVLVTDERSGKEKVSGEFHGYRAEPVPWYLSLKKIQIEYGERHSKWAEIVRDLNLPDYFFDNNGKCNKASYAKGLERYLEDNEVPFDPPDLSETQALGLRSNVVSNLPSVYLLPAITDYANEIDRRSNSSTFRRLMGDLSERILKNDPRFNELLGALKTIEGLLNLNRTSEPISATRIESISAIENKISDLIRRVMPSVTGVTMDVKVQEIKDIFSAGVSLRVNDGIETDVLAKGHGLQRCFVFTLLQALILNERNQLIPRDELKPEQTQKPIILMVEEPELYIHPQLAKLIFDVLHEFSITDQVIYSTHSPLFVNAHEAENVAIVTKTSTQIGTVVSNCDLSAFEGLGDGKVFKGLSKLNPAINELFFARQVLLVEGPEDLIAITAVLQKYNRIKYRVEELNWSVIPCGGKESIPFFQRVLNAFKIPYAVLHDLDVKIGMKKSDEDQHHKRNKEIQVLSRGQPIFTFPIKLEDSLGLSEHFNSQYAAHKFFANDDDAGENIKDLILTVFNAGSGLN